ncbi:MAG: Na+/H+ antiporter NhaC family protein [Bacteroidota bacterium]
MEHTGFISLIPTLVVLLLALWTRKTFESLLGGALVGFMIHGKGGFFEEFTNTLLAVMQDATIGWIILVCGLFGSLIHLLVKSGGTLAFAEQVLTVIHNRSSALLATWGLGIIIFIDDYLNALTIGSSMKRVTDKFKVPREMLAYVVDSTAAPICVLIPLSTWALYIASLLEELTVAEKGEGLATYLHTIPFIVYGWVAVLVVPLVIMKWIPPVGAMKVAEERVRKGGPTIPPTHEVKEEISPHFLHQPKLYLFLLPILLLISATIFFDTDALKGVMIATVFTVALYIWQKIMTFSEAMEHVFDGFKQMLYALAIIVMSFVLKEVNDQLGLTQYVIEMVSPWMNKAWLPAIAFVALSGITFATGSFWGVYAISLPIIIPLAQELDVNMWLAIGAVISAGSFGSHACFYGDATVLSASATDCDNMSHVLTQLPYALIAGGVATVIYVVLGYVV